MKTRKMRNAGFMLALLFMLTPWTAELYGQRYKNNIGVHYGLFQYNNAQNNQLLDVEGGFLSAGLSYKYNIGRYSSLGITGRLYEWQLNDVQALKTQSLESKWLIHAGRISNSWRVNLITPYVGAGIGYEMHTLTQNGTDYLYNNAYVPIEAGFFFNLGTRLSLGVFAEYKLSAESDLKTRLGLEGQYPAVINSAGLTLAWQFGQRKEDIRVPVVATNPSFVQPDDKKLAEETRDMADKLFSDTLNGIIDSIPSAIEKMQEPDSLTPEPKLPVILPEVINAVMDTLRIPIILDFSIKGLKDDEVRPLTIYGQTPVDSSFADTRIDSLLRLTHNLLQKIDMLGRTPNDQYAPGVSGTTMPTITGQPQQPRQFQQSQQFQQPQQPQQIQQAAPQIPRQTQSPAQTPVIIAPASTPSADNEVFATKNDIEALRAEIRNLSAENREAIRMLSQNIRVTGVSAYRIQEDTAAVKPDTMKQTDPSDEILGADFYMLPDTITEKVVAEQVGKPGALEEKKQLKLDSLQTVKDDLAKELKMQKEQNLKLKEEISILAQFKEVKEIQASEDVSLQYTIYFDVNSAEISTEHNNKLSQIATQMLENPDLKVQLSGYADGTGDPEYNALLSRWRVKAVREEFLKAGIPQLRIFEQYFGSQSATGGLNPDERKVEINLF